MTTLRSVNDGLTSFLPFSFLLCRDAGQSVITDGSLRLSHRPARSSLSLQGARALLTSFHSINKARACARSFVLGFVGLSFVVRFWRLALWWAFFKTIVENEFNLLKGCDKPTIVCQPENDNISKPGLIQTVLFSITILTFSSRKSKLSTSIRILLSTRVGGCYKRNEWLKLYTFQSANVEEIKTYLQNE